MKNKLFKISVCIYIVYCLICHFANIKITIENAMRIWINIIIPSVFPYLVLAKYICNSDVLDVLEVFPGNLISKIFKLSDCSIKAVICSLFCGYPSGSICAADLYAKGQIEKEEAKRLICFTNNAGPLFLISAVGGGLLGSIHKGVAIYIIHLISALIYGYISSFGKRCSRNCGTAKKAYRADLCLSIKESVVTAVNICAFMIVAYVLAECVLIFAEKLLTPQIGAEYITTFIKGIFEISAGVSRAAQMEYSSLNFAIICGFVSWSGISVIMQIKSVAGSIISTKKIVFAKLTQGIMSFIMGYIFDCITKDNSLTLYKNDYGIKVSLILSVLIYAYYIWGKMKKLSD